MASLAVKHRVWWARYLSIPVLAAVMTWVTGVLVISYSAGELGSRTPNYGFPLSWVTVGYIQGCELVTPGCFIYVVDWVFLTFDMLLYAAISVLLMAYLRVKGKSLPYALVLQKKSRVLKTLAIVILVSIALEPLVAGALVQGLPCVNCPPRESIVLDSFHLNSPTNATLRIRNTGPITVSLINYEAQDGKGNQWWRIWLPPNESTGTWWSGPTISLNSTGTAIITIGSSCGNCTYRGTTGAFTQFDTNNAYTITVVTGRDYQFVFPVTA